MLSLSCRFGTAGVATLFGPAHWTWRFAAGERLAGSLLAYLDRFCQAGVLTLFGLGQCRGEVLVLGDRGMGDTLLVRVEDAVGQRKAAIRAASIDDGFETASGCRPPVRLFLAKLNPADGLSSR
jgi:hypothetical protein